MSNEEASTPEVDPNEVVDQAEQVNYQDQLGAEVGQDGHPEEDAPLEGEVSIEVLQVQLAEAREQLQISEDRTLRVTADIQNARRRAEKDVANAHKYGIEKFVRELLPVIDGLERGLEAVSEEDEALRTAREGMVLTHKIFLDALKKFGVEPVYPEGEPFDPNLHEAVSMQPNPDVEPNSVLAVFQKGYTLSGRLIRPAMVVVAKG